MIGRRGRIGFALVLAACACLCFDDPVLAEVPPASGGTPVGAGREPTGCTSTPGEVVTDGSRGDDVALTFDDGPSFTQTPEILAILNRLHGRATFFEEGHHVHGREALMNEILSSGDEIGNHSY